MTEINLDEIGYIEVAISGCTLRVDAISAYNRVLALDQVTPKPTADEFLGGVVALLQELGFPVVSHHTADRFVRGIIGVVSELKKKESAGTPPG